MVAFVALSNVYLTYEILSLKKKNLHILCSLSRAYYRADFYGFGLKMTVEEWSSFLPRKIEVFKILHCKKIQLFFRALSLRARQKGDISLILWCP